MNAPETLPGWLESIVGWFKPPATEEWDPEQFSSYLPYRGFGKPGRRPHVLQA